MQAPLTGTIKKSKAIELNYFPTVSVMPEIKLISKHIQPINLNSRINEVKNQHEKQTFSPALRRGSILQDDHSRQLSPQIEASKKGLNWK